MGRNVMSLIETAERQVRRGRRARASRAAKACAATISISRDFLDQMRTVRKMGPLTNVARDDPRPRRRAAEKT